MKKILIFSIILISNTLSQSLRAQVWTQKADFPKCAYDGISFATDNFVFYGLGIDCIGEESNEFYKYDPSTDEWTEIAPFPGPARRKASAFSIQGKGYVCLGFSSGMSLKDLWEYDPDADTWTNKSDFVGQVRGAAFASVVNEKAYVGTGFGPGGNSLYPQDMWLYDPNTDTWTEKTSMPAILLYDTRSFVINENIYVIGGYGTELIITQNEFWVYSTTTDTWTQLADFPGGSPRNLHNAFSLKGIGYCGYGFRGFDYLGDFYAYTPGTNTWEQVQGHGFGGLLFDAASTTATAAYCISGVLASDPSPATTAVWEMKPTITAVDEATHIEISMNISPNPIKESAIIKVSVTGQYTIYNILGQVMKNIYLDKNEDYLFQTTNWDAGTYILSAEQHNRLNQKFVIVK